MSTAAKTVTMAELATLAGSRIGTSEPHEVSQHRIRTFADATEDHQWIHVDPARAATGPFAGTIAQNGPVGVDSADRHSAGHKLPA